MATTINAGRVAMVPKGEWDATTAYTRLDVVLYNGSSWVAIQDSTGQAPASGSTYWQLLARGVDSTNYYTKAQVDEKIAASSPVRVKATWDASTSAYVSETDVDTMYSIFYTQGKVLELHLVNGNWNGSVLLCHGSYVDGNNARHMLFSGIVNGNLVEADVVGTAVAINFAEIADIFSDLHALWAGKQDSRLVVSVTHDAANDTYSANTTWAEIDAALSGGREVVVKYLGLEYTLGRYGAGVEAVWYNMNDVTYTEVLIDSTGSVTVSADFDLVDYSLLNSILPTKQDVSPITNSASGALVVNEYRDFGRVSALTVTLTGGTMANYDLYKFAFTCASDSTTLTLPSGVKLPVDMEMEMATGRRFECVIDYANCLTFNCWD